MEIPKKRVTSLPQSSKAKQSGASKKILAASCSKCLFCYQERTTKKGQLHYFPEMINKALYAKFSSSQNYYYTRGINEFLSNARTSNVIKFKDTQSFDENDEYLKRFYKLSEYNGKIRMLAEYYKFHQDIARLFMLPVTNVVNRYHDKKRKLEYLRVTKLLKEQTTTSHPAQKHENFKSNNLKQIPLTDRVLEDLDLTESEAKALLTENSEKIQSAAHKPHRNFFRDGNNQNRPASKGKFIEAAKTDRGHRDMKVEEDNVIQSRDVSISNTIQDLNMKLGEIINQSYSRPANPEVLSYLDNSEQQNDTISNLNNFLTYMQTSNQNSKIHRIPEISSAKLPQQHKKTNVPKTCGSHETDSKNFSNTESNDLYNIYNDQSKKPAVNKRKDPKEPAHTEAAIKRVTADLFKKKSKTIVSTNGDEKSQKLERPTTALTSVPLSIQPPNSTRTAKAKNIPPPVMKIQNFEEALKSRQQGSPFKVDSQRSASREGNVQRPPISLSHRAYDARNSKPQEIKPREMLSVRRRSQVNNGESSEQSMKTHLKTKSIHNPKEFNNGLEKNMEISGLTTQNTSGRPNSHRDMRISLDVNAFGRQINQHGGLSNTNTYTGKTISKSGQIKVLSNAVTVSNDKSKDFKATPNSVGTYTVKEMKSLANFGNLELREQNVKSASHASSKKQNLRPHLTTREGYHNTHNMGVIPEQEIVNLKHYHDLMPKKAITYRDTGTASGYHKYTKSEVKFGKIEANILAKKGSLPHAVPFIEQDQSTYDKSRLAKDRENSPSKKMYTYNHNNIVNIFVHPHHEKISHEPGLSAKANSKKSGALTERGTSSSTATKLATPKPNSPEVFIKYNNQSQIKKSQIYDNTIRRESGRESPLKAVRKEDVRPTKSKSGNYGPFMTTTSNIYSKSALANKIKGKVELDLAGKEMKVNDENYEILLKFKDRR